VQPTDQAQAVHRLFFLLEAAAASEYDSAVVQAHGPGAKRNFPGEAISELPVTVGEERKQRSSSRYIGVTFNKASSSWHVLADPQSKRTPQSGHYASEEDAGRTAVRLCWRAEVPAPCNPRSVILPQQTRTLPSGESLRRRGETLPVRGGECD
jgi:hypothetical protein